MAWLIFLLQAELSRVPSPCSESKFYRTRWAWFLQQTTRLPEVSNFSSPCLCQASTCYVLGISWKLWVIGTKPYLQRWLLPSRKAYPKTLPKLDCTGLEGCFSRIFEVRSYKMARWLGGHMQKPKLAGKMPLEYPRYSPCLGFGGYRIPITYYQNQNNPMIGEIFGESVCDRIIWELQYLLRNYLDSCM